MEGRIDMVLEKDCRRYGSYRWKDGLIWYGRGIEGLYGKEKGMIEWDGSR